MKEKFNSAVTYCQTFTWNENNKTLSPVLIGNQPYFVAVEVCDMLGLTNPTESLKSLDEDEKLTSVLLRAGRLQEHKFGSSKLMITFVLDCYTYFSWAKNHFLYKIDGNAHYGGRLGNDWRQMPSVCVTVTPTVGIPYILSQILNSMTVIKNVAGTLLPQVFIFKANNRQVRTVLIEDQPYFIAKDICNALELSDVSMSMQRLDDDEKLSQVLFVSGQGRQMWIVSESGLYHLIFQSRKPEAKVFRKWVTSEVLPTLRRTGRYEMTTAKQRTDFVDLRCEPYTTQQLEGYPVRTIRYEDAAWYSVSDILRAIQVGTNVRQCVHQLNARREMARKIFIFGNTHPSWFTTITGLRLIVSGSRKLRRQGRVGLALAEGGAL